LWRHPTFRIGPLRTKERNLPWNVSPLAVSKIVSGSQGRTITFQDLNFKELDHG
tara:strand:- start:12479 stop:12640 length:162 start_codon:yes stop_codon:yes gene_type:complete